MSEYARRHVLQKLKSKRLEHLKYHINRFYSHQCKVMSHGIAPENSHCYSVNGSLLGHVYT